MARGENVSYGTELILDLHNCRTRFSRDTVTLFMEELCDLLGMTRADLHFWDYEGQEDEHEVAPAHLSGISAVQFITTSNITIHTLDKLDKVFLNIFTCSALNKDRVTEFCTEYWKGYAHNVTQVTRA